MRAASAGYDAQAILMMDPSGNKRVFRRE
jgi:hypothetical protein